jgi:5-methylcytosine-specific restriction enzyme A
MANWPYNTTEWKRLRKAKLARQPHCEPCAKRGVATPANTVDHTLPIAKGGHPFPAFSGLISMCPSCHNSKTATFDRGRQVKPFARRVKGFDANGNPVDASDDWHGGGGSNHGKRAGAETVEGLGRYLVSDDENDIGVW